MTAAESVARLRNWASGRCLNADAPGGILHRQSQLWRYGEARPQSPAGPVEQLNRPGTRTGCRGGHVPPLLPCSLNWLSTLRR